MPAVEKLTFADRFVQKRLVHFEPTVKTITTVAVASLVISALTLLVVIGIAAGGRNGS